MASFNRVILLGNMTRDAELRYTPSGTAVTDITLAVNDRRKGANGEWIEEATFVDITLWGRTAEIASEYLGKGSPALIEGRLKLDTWEKDGKKNSKLKVIGERLQLLGSKQGGGRSGSPTGGTGRPAAYDESEFGAPNDSFGEPSGSASATEPFEKDIPF